MMSNVLEFPKAIQSERVSIDCEAAKKYFISEVLPYVCAASVQRLITANVSDNQELVRLEMLRMFVESELMRPTMLNTSKLQNFFSESQVL